MPVNRDRNKAGEGLMWKNKWKRDDFKKLKQEKIEIIEKKRISLNNWSEIS